MNKIYQLVVKGIHSNRISVYDFNTYTDFNAMLLHFKNSGIFEILHTNIYTK